MKYSDKELVDGMLVGDEQVIRYFFCVVCTPVLNYINKNVFYYKVEQNEFINELFLYLQENDWQKLRQFDYRSKLTTWLSVVATRFSKKKHSELLGKELPNTPIEKKSDCFEQQINRKLEVETLLKSLPNDRYRMVIQELFLKDKTPQDVAYEMGITVDNLYNIKHRALEQLRQLIRKEGGYDR